MLLYSESDQKCAKNYSDRKLSYLKFLNYRKEKLSPPFISLKSIRAFFFTTPVGWKCWKGTLTVEAALVVPVFLFLMIAVLQYAQTMEASVCYGAALAEAGRGQAVQVYTAPDISGTGTALRQMEPFVAKYAQRPETAVRQRICESKAGKGQEMPMCLSFA